VSGISSRLEDVFFINDQTGWAVGAFGTVLKTIDGGINWETQLSVGSFDLKDVHFIDNLTGWIVVASDDWISEIFRTSDGGMTWQQQSFESIGYFSAIYFANSQIGWAVGWSGTIIKYEGLSSPLAAFTYSTQSTTTQFFNTSTNATSSFWDFGDGQFSGEENPLYTYAASAEYLVKLTVTNACGGISTVEQIITVTVGVTTPNFLDVFDLYPNPAADQFTLQLKGPVQQSLQVGLFNSTGQRLYQEVLDFQSGVVQKTISCRDLPSGMYWVRVSDGSGSGIRKMVVE
jgi:PKD repeat protein